MSNPAIQTSVIYVTTIEYMYVRQVLTHFLLNLEDCKLFLFMTSCRSIVVGYNSI